MKNLRLLIIGGSLGVAVVARAVYAPIPDQEKGREFAVSLRAGITYDTNIFGAPTHDIHSVVFDLSPKIAFNASLSEQTFLTADYRLSLDDFTNRPGQKLLDSHAFDARLAHSFSRDSTLDITETFTLTHNPESTLAGVPINADQSYLSNQVDGHYSFSPVDKAGVVLKARTIYYDYLSSVLGHELNRYENLFGAEGTYSLLPDVKAAFEYRHEDVLYDNNASTNDKHSDFLMGGADYSAGPKLSASGRLGIEYRQADGYGHQTVPYAEFSAKYDLSKESFVSAGYVYTLAETSDPIHFTDEKMNRLFVNVQQSLSPLFVASGSVDFEPSRLIGRLGLPSINETTTRFGAALSYLPAKNTTISATYDYDYVNSGEVFRGMNRSRFGISGSYTF